MAGTAGTHPPSDAGAGASRCAPTLARGIAVLGFCGSVLGCVSRSGSSQEEDVDPDPEDIRDAHGSVVVDLRRAGSEATSPWAGTAAIVIALAYDACLQRFYLEHPDFAQDGEYGNVIFGDADSGWFDECKIGGPLECRVLDVRQDLASPVASLTLRYAVPEPTHTPRLGFGPLPSGLVEVMDACATPSIMVGRLDLIYAEDATGKRILEATEVVIPSVPIYSPYPRLTVGMKRVPE
jgi:hypothetical protein